MNLRKIVSYLCQYNISFAEYQIPAKDSTQKPERLTAKAMFSSWSGKHRKRLTTEAARIRSKGNRQLFVTRSPQKTHDRSRKDSQQRQSLVVCQAITAKDSRQKPQGFAAKAIGCCFLSEPAIITTWRSLSSRRRISRLRSR